jgi:hypothetical protein
MPSILNVRLDVGRNADKREFARVNFDVSFSSYEVTTGIPYTCDILLFEIDSGKDEYYRSLINPRSYNWRGGNRDDFIGWISSFTINPSSDIQHFELERAWSFPNNEVGEEEYEALVSLVPFVGTAAKWSNRININLA